MLKANMKRQINLAEFVSVCMFLAERGGDVIRDIALKTNYQQQTKQDDSPVTEADLKVQKMIIENFLKDKICFKRTYEFLPSLICL